MSGGEHRDDVTVGSHKEDSHGLLFPSSHPLKDGERKGLWQEIHSRSENGDSDFPSEDLEEPTYQSIFMILENVIHKEARILLKTLVCIYCTDQCGKGCSVHPG